MARGKRRRLVPSSSVRKRKKIDWIEYLISIFRKYPLKIPSRNVSEQQKKDYYSLTNFKQNVFVKKFASKLPKELIKVSKDCPWFIPYLYSVKVDWTERILVIIQKYPLKPPSQSFSEEQKKDYKILNSFKQHVFRKRLKGKLPEALIEASKDCPWIIPFLSLIKEKVDWTRRIIGFIRKYPLKPPSLANLEEQKDSQDLNSFRQKIFRKKLKGKLPEELIEASKDSPWIIPFFYLVKVDWIRRIIGIIQKYPLNPPSEGISEKQKKDYRVLITFKQNIFRKRLKGKLPEELIEVSKDSSWFLLWVLS